MLSAGMGSRGIPGNPLRFHAAGADFLAERNRADPDQKIQGYRVFTGFRFGDSGLA